MWVLGAFAGFTILFFLVQTLFGTSPVTDPRSPERLAIKGEVLAEQDALVTKMGLSDDTKKADLYRKSAEELKKRTAAKSAFVVPGSPTQLKQMAEGAPPPPADGAPAATPTTPAKP